MTDRITTEIAASLPPPRATTGPVVWVRRNLFATPGNIVLTILGAVLLIVVVPPILDWAIFSANFQAGTSRADCVHHGACWTMVRARFIAAARCTSS